MLNKIKKYYQIFGFKETCKKILRYIEFKYKTRDCSDLVYKFRKKEKNEIILKKRLVYVFANSSLYDLSENHKLLKLVNQLNAFGCSVEYYYRHRLNKRKTIFVSRHAFIHDIIDLDFSSSPIVIFEDLYDEYETYIEEAMNSRCKVVLISNKIDVKFLKKYKRLVAASEVVSFNYSFAKQLENIFIKNNLKKNIIVGEDINNLIEKTWGLAICNEKFYNNISVVVLNHNNKKVIRHCLNSLIENNVKYNYEIVVVDNQSTDGSYEMLKKEYPGVHLYRNIKNGCSSGRNLGALKSTKDYLLFLDSDQWALNKYWLDNYIDIINDDDIGAIGWTAGWFNKKGFSYHTVDNFEYRYMPPIGLYRKDIGYIGTGGLMIKKEFFKQISGFDEFYDPTCYEDTDLSLKVRDNGKEIVYCPYLGVGHMPHQTTKSGSVEHNKLINSKGIYFINKWKKKNPKLLKYIK